MTCPQCNKKLLESQFMEMFDNSVPLLYDNSVNQPKGKNGFARTMIENRPGNEAPLLYDGTRDNNGFVRTMIDNRPGNANRNGPQSSVPTIPAVRSSHYVPTIPAVRSSHYAPTIPAVRSSAYAPP